ncbi:MAG TPA: DUF1573 domain-containing protein [Puia sp.]|jgi:hypothetical protein|nr:DUF1573 domain-containing protein [Puia sp.]
MRIFLLYFILTATIFSCVNKDKPATINEAALKDSANFTTIQWLDSTNKNFGTIAEGQKLEVAFHFKNSGNKPLVIARVQPSCGCTVAEQPTEPIAPGKEGNIKAVFDSENHTGVNHKTLYVYANTKGTQANELQFAVVVEKKKW